MKQWYKQAGAWLGAAGLALSLAGCGGAKVSSSSAASPAASAPASSSAAVDSVAQSTAEPTQSYVVQGTVVAASMNSVTIRTAEGRELTFPTVDAEVDTVNGLLEGNWVAVEYRADRELTGTDTTGAYVDRVIDNAPNVQEEAQKVLDGMEDCDETVYATHRVHVRTGNSTDAKILATIDKGTQLHRTGKGPHGWSRVEYNGQTAYVFGEYLSTAQPTQALGEQADKNTAFTAADETVYSTVRLRIRQNPSLDAAKVGVVDAGTALHRTGTYANGWSQVDYNGVSAYCDSEYLTAKAPAGAVDQDAAPAGEVNFAPANETYYTTVALKLHVTYSTDSTVVAVVPKGTALYVESLMDNHWCQVQYNNKTVYCVTQYLQQEQPQAPNAQQPEAFTAADESVFPITNLHIRETPSLGGKILETPAKGSEFHRTGISMDGAWSRVEYNGVSGYSATQYLTTQRPSQMNAGEPAVTDVEQTVTTTANLRLHDSDDLTATIVAVVPAGTQLERVGVLSSGWSIVMYNGQRLFCASDYLK